MNVYKAPEQIKINKLIPSIFLAGTIDMGNSLDWQQEVELHFSNEIVDIYNPRRNGWDSSWKQKFDSPEFFQQVMWEKDALRKANIIIMNFLPDSQSPITLLEFGLWASSGKLLVCCPDKFWRSGNVQIECNDHDIPMFKTLDELLKTIKL